jgi:hypothetical protein
MTCRHLHHYSLTGSEWTVASCSAKATPYVPSLSELKELCTGGSHIACPSYIFPVGSAYAAEDNPSRGCVTAHIRS